MSHEYVLVNAILWAVAIVAAAAAGATTFLSLILLPSLAAIALLIARPRHCVRSHTAE